MDNQFNQIKVKGHKKIWIIIVIIAIILSAGIYYYQRIKHNSGFWSSVDYRFTGIIESINDNEIIVKNTRATETKIVRVAPDTEILVRRGTFGGPNIKIIGRFDDIYYDKATLSFLKPGDEIEIGTNDNIEQNNVIYAKWILKDNIILVD